MRRLNQLLTTLLLTGFALGAQAVPLTDLLQGGTIEVEDKVFHDFELVLSLDPTEGAAIDLSGIEVTGLASEAGEDNPGLLFEVNDDALSILLPQDPEGDELLLWFSYSVTVMDPTMAIVGSEMELTGASVDNAVEGLVWVEKLVDGESIEVFIDQVDQEGFADMQLTDAVSFGPQNSIVVDDIIIVSGGEGDTVALTSWEQRFNQREVGVPIPGTLALIGLGLLGLARLRRS